MSKKGRSTGCSASGLTPKTNLRAVWAPVDVCNTRFFKKKILLTCSPMLVRAPTAQKLPVGRFFASGKKNGKIR